MNERELNALIAILIKRHGHAAEAIARKRALRCRRMLEEAWAEIWGTVADRIAQQRLTEK
jgi:hypothetical protein